MFALAPTAHTRLALTQRVARRSNVLRVAAQSKPQDEAKKQSIPETLNYHMLLAAAAVTPMMLAAEPAQAIDREYGLLEGTIFSMMHPVVMGGLFATSLYAAYLGFKWRETRTIPEQIKELKMQLPAANAEGVVPPSEAGAKIAQLEAVRKDLIKARFNDKHEIAGAFLLGGGVMFSIAGAYNTFLRTGKLFPGPHLYAGALITVLWALAAALVPAMKKGNETARSVHIGLNVANILLFVSQVPTGLEIVEKVLQFTTLP